MFDRYRTVRDSSDKRRGKIKSWQVSWKSRIFIETSFRNYQDQLFATTGGALKSVFVRRFPKLLYRKL